MRMENREITQESLFLGEISPDSHFREKLMLPIKRLYLAPLAATLLFGMMTLSPLLADGLGDPQLQAKTSNHPEVDRPLIGYPNQDVELMKGDDTVWSVWRVEDKEYFAQPNDWTCSASCYVMMFRTLVQADISLAEAVERCGAQAGVGAKNETVVKAFESLGDRYQVVSGLASESEENPPVDQPELMEEKKVALATLKKLLEDGYLVMINFREPEEHIGHYGVLQGLNDRAIQIADPYYGNVSVLTLDQFDYRSGFSKPILQGWYLAVRPKDL
jgi:hypothetical protein